MEVFRPSLLKPVLPQLEVFRHQGLDVWHLAKPQSRKAEKNERHEKNNMGEATQRPRHNIAWGCWPSNNGEVSVLLVPIFGVMGNGEAGRVDS